MADNNNQLAEVVNKPLEELPFDHIIGGPLRACAEAQQEAAQATFEYITQMGLENDDTGLAQYKPAMLSFIFVKDGVAQRIKVPLLSVIPVPYLLIDKIDLTFQATVTGCSQNSLTAKFAASSPNVSVNVKGDSSSQVTAMENIDIRVSAMASEIPSGMAKLIEILQTQMTEINDY